jgi:hypothetical protein
MRPRKNNVENKGCRLALRHYSGMVKFSSLAKVLAMVAALLVIGTGCGGFAGSSTVSPLMFLLPGLARTKPALPQPPAPVQTATNPIVALAD